jgi:hypothetical protein
MLAILSLFMAGIRIGLRNMSDAKKVEFARGLIRQMSGNPSFSAATSALSNLTVAIGELEHAYNEARAARQVAKAKTQMRRAASSALDGMVKQLARIVEISAGSDPGKLQASGFDVRSGRTSVGRLEAPENLNVEITGTAGEVRLRWKNVRGASTYLVHRTANPEDAPSWTQVAASTRAKITLTEQPRGARLWFRICAVGAAGMGAWSSAVERFVP